MCVCVITAKCGPGETYDRGNCHSGGFDCSARHCHAATKLYRCVVRIKMKTVIFQILKYCKYFGGKISTRLTIHIKCDTILQINY